MTGICTVRLPGRPTVRVRTTLEPRAVRTARVGPPAAFAGVADGADAGTAGARRVGAGTCGKCAAGSDSAGIATGTAGASISERIASAIITAYGRASDIAHATANQNRIRRLPRPFRPNVPAVPEPWVPESAGIKRLATYRHPADRHCGVIPPTPGAPKALRRPPLHGAPYSFSTVPDRHVRSQYRGRRKVPACCGIVGDRVVKDGRAGPPRRLGSPAGVTQNGVQVSRCGGRPRAPRTAVTATLHVQALLEPQMFRTRLASG